MSIALIATLQLFGCYHDSINLALDKRGSSGVPPEEQPKLYVITLPLDGGKATAEKMSEVTIVEPLTARVPTIFSETPNSQFLHAHRSLYQNPNGERNHGACPFNYIAMIDLNPFPIDKSHALLQVVCDFPVIDQRLTGRRCRYSWLACMDTATPAVAFNGLAKMDLWAPIGQDACVGRINMQKGCFAGAVAGVLCVSKGGGVLLDSICAGVGTSGNGKLFFLGS